MTMINFLEFHDKINHPGLKKKGKNKELERKRIMKENNNATMQMEEFALKKFYSKLLNHKFLLRSLITPRLKNSATYSNPS